MSRKKFFFVVQQVKMKNTAQMCERESMCIACVLRERSKKKREIRSFIRFVKI